MFDQIYFVHWIHVCTLDQTWSSGNGHLNVKKKKYQKLDIFFKKKIAKNFLFFFKKIANEGQPLIPSCYALTSLTFTNHPLSTHVTISCVIDFLTNRNILSFVCHREYPTQTLSHFPRIFIHNKWDRTGSFFYLRLLDRQCSQS